MRTVRKAQEYQVAGASDAKCVQPMSDVKVVKNQATCAKTQRTRVDNEPMSDVEVLKNQAAGLKAKGKRVEAINVPKNQATCRKRVEPVSDVVQVALKNQATCVKAKGKPVPESDVKGCEAISHVEFKAMSNVEFEAIFFSLGQGVKENPGAASDQPEAMSDVEAPDSASNIK
eukprot:g4304.t1